MSHRIGPRAAGAKRGPRSWRRRAFDSGRPGRSAEDLGRSLRHRVDEDPFGNLQTWEALREFEQHHVASGGSANGKRHQVTNVHVVGVSDDEARVTHDMIVLEVAQEPRVIATGRYDDSVVARTADVWRFKSRKLHVDPGFFELMKKWQGQGT